MNDEQRLNGLISTVNDTARTARAAMSLFLVAAFYLLWILISSTDEALFLNGHLVLGQLNIGLSLKNSYIIGPLILLFLHAYLLTLLQGLRRRVSIFESVLRIIYPEEDQSTEREELRNRISPSIFVQSIQNYSNKFSRSLAFLSVVAAPLSLLFAADLFFVRYQSDAITRFHDFLVLIDLILILCFGVNSGRWSNLCEIKRHLREIKRKDALSRLVTRIGQFFQRTEKQPPGTSGPTGVTPWMTLLFIILIVLPMLLILWFATCPPVFDHETVEEDQKRIWRDERHEAGDASGPRKTWDDIFDVFKGRRNILDAVSCNLWGWEYTCRYIDVSTKELVRMSNRELSARVSREYEDEDEIALFHEEVIDLNSRKFRFAKLTKTWMQGGSFIEADLRGANLRGAHLDAANFVRAELQGADLWGARLDATNFLRAELQGANLANTRLRNADLGKANAMGANFLRADLRSATLGGAQLQGVDLSEADLISANMVLTNLQGADLSEADLRGAILWRARLQGARLIKANIQGANLADAKLQGADFTNARLQGTDFTNVQLQGSFGKPDSWCLLWMPGAFLPPLHNPHGALLSVEELLSKGDKDIKLVWEKKISLEEHLKECLSEGIRRGVFNDSRPEEKCMVYHESAVTGWCPPSDIDSRCYREAWAAWTAGFACENRYTAASSLDRWLSDEPLYEAKTRFKCLADLKATVRAAMIERKKSGECPSLSAVSKSNEEYSKYLSAWTGPPSPCGSCGAERPDCAPSSRAAQAPAQQCSSSP